MKAKKLLSGESLLEAQQIALLQKSELEMETGEMDKAITTLQKAAKVNAELERYRQDKKSVINFNAEQRAVNIPEAHSGLLLNYLS